MYLIYSSKTDKDSNLNWANFNCNGNNLHNVLATCLCINEDAKKNKNRNIRKLIKTSQKKIGMATMADFRPPYSISNLPPDAIPELACYNSTVDLSDNIWKRGNVIGEAVPLLSIQIAYIVLLSSIFHRIFKPFHLPLMVSQILVSVHMWVPCINTFFLI